MTELKFPKNAFNDTQPYSIANKMELAVEQGDMAALKALLKQGADINEKTRAGNTALITASIRGRTEVARLLIGKGAALDEKNNNGDTALIVAVLNKNKETVCLLLDHGATLDKKGMHGETALDIAVRKNFKAIAQMLQDEPARRTEEKNRAIALKRQHLKELARQHKPNAGPAP